MAQTIIKAQIRDQFGKGASRRLRRSKLIPAVMYARGDQPIHLALPSHVTTLALRVANALLEIDLDGKKTQLALAKQIQRNPVTDAVTHLDLIIVKRGEKVQVEVPLTVVGEVKGDAVVIVDQNTILLEVEATAIPAFIEVDVNEQEVGHIINAQDLVLPPGAVLRGDPETLILSIQVPQAKDLGEAPEDEAGEEVDETGSEE